MLFSSSAQDPEFVAGIIKHVSSAHLTISFPARVGLRSAAVIKYDGGPIPDPCIILAVSVATEDVTLPYLVQCMCPVRKLAIQLHLFSVMSSLATFSINF